MCPLFLCPPLTVSSSSTFYLPKKMKAHCFCRAKRLLICRNIKTEENRHGRVCHQLGRSWSPSDFVQYQRQSASAEQVGPATFEKTAFKIVPPLLSSG